MKFFINQFVVISYQEGHCKDTYLYKKCTLSKYPNLCNFAAFSLHFEDKRMTD